MTRGWEPEAVDPGPENVRRIVQAAVNSQFQNASRTPSHSLRAHPSIFTVTSCGVRFLLLRTLAPQNRPPYVAATSTISTAWAEASEFESQTDVVPKGRGHRSIDATPFMRRRSTAHVLIV